VWLARIGLGCVGLERIQNRIADLCTRFVTYPRVSFSMCSNEADVDATIRAVLEIANRP